MKAAIDLLKYHLSLSGLYSHENKIDFSVAIRVLEAAGKVDKASREYLIEYLKNEIEFQMSRGYSEVAETLSLLLPLLEALPEEGHEADGMSSKECLKWIKKHGGLPKALPEEEK